MTDHQRYKAILAKEPDQLAAFEARIAEIADTGISMTQAREQARIDFRDVVVKIQARPAPEKKQRQPPKEKVKQKRKAPPTADAPTPPLKADFRRDLEFVYHTMGLKDDALEEAKLKAPSGGALAWLDLAIESMGERKLIIDQMRKLWTDDQKEADKGGRGKSSKPQIDLINRILVDARKASGLPDYFDDDDEGHDADMETGVASAGAENASGEPALPSIAD